MTTECPTHGDRWVRRVGPTVGLPQGGLLCCHESGPSLRVCGRIVGGDGGNPQPAGHQL